MDKNILKHHKYKKFYKNDTIYWGLGIENEVYLELENIKKMNKVFLLNNKRERYSVDSSLNYKSEDLLKNYIFNLPEQVVELPILLNSHSFTKTDCFNNPKTLYTKHTEPNPKFNGETLIETLSKHNHFFKNSDYWEFDGDTIEFTTLNFFNTTLEDILDELDFIKELFVDNLNNLFKKLNIFQNYGSVNIMKKNYPFASYLTNVNNVNTFNNGTLHYNITLPTKLNKYGKIEDYPRFIKDHSKAIKIIQWVEPLLIAVYGSGDPFMTDIPSQRCAVCRYIGVGTYDSDLMRTGKILTCEIPEEEYYWYNLFDKYSKLNEIGMDINFNKHHNHGIEIRFLDHLDKELIKESFEFIVYLMDIVLINNRINYFGNPIKNKLWNNIVLQTMLKGKNYKLKNEEKRIYESIFKMKLKKQQINDIYYEILKKFKKQKTNMFCFKQHYQFSNLVLNNPVKCF